MRSTKRDEGTVGLVESKDIEQRIEIIKFEDGTITFKYNGIHCRHDANVLLKLCDRDVRIKCSTAQLLSA